MKKKTRGGAREGAGRPKGQGRYGEPTRIMRVPISLIDTVKDMMESKTKEFTLPLYDMTVSAGTPSITDCDNYELYNLNTKLVQLIFRLSFKVLCDYINDAYIQTYKKKNYT